jgi:hypothetical protein
MLAIFFFVEYRNQESLSFVGRTIVTDVIWCCWLNVGLSSKSNGDELNNF